MKTPIKSAEDYEQTDNRRFNNFLSTGSFFKDPEKKIMDRAKKHHENYGLDMDDNWEFSKFTLWSLVACMLIVGAICYVLVMVGVFFAQLSKDQVKTLICLLGLLVLCVVFWWVVNSIRKA